jgi:outer membrane immunogenic protein
MKKVLLGSVGIAALLTAGAANAADLPAHPVYKAPVVAPAVFSWTGCYVGANVGWGFADRNNTGTLDGFTPDFTPTVTLGNNVPQNLGLRPEGVIGGGQIGCNWQSGFWVWGVEADFQGSDIHDSTTINLPGTGVFVPSTSTAEDRLRWFGTVRARLGFTVTPQWLLYATGGFAYGRVEDSASLFFTPATAGTFFGSHSETRGGWTVGAGTEYAFAPTGWGQWSFKIEYLFVDLGTTKVTEFDPVHFPASSISYDFEHREHIVRAGLNYRFNWGGPVIARY